MPEAYNNRGVVYRIRAQYDKAISEFTKALMINPSYALAYENRGRALIQAGQIEKGCADLRMGCELGRCKYHDEMFKKRGVCK
jgi:tetratricopeptide (TPR) repeat protein